VGSTTPPLPGASVRIEAENYTSMSGIQTENTLDEGGGKNVGWIEQGDWMDYQVSVASAGTYALNLRIATPNTGAQLQIRKQDGSVLSTVNLPAAGWWQSWQTVSTNITLQAGTQTIRVISTAAPGWNFNWMEISGGNMLAIKEKDILHMPMETSFFDIYPNPVTKNLTLSTNLDYKGKIKVQVINMAGALIKEYSLYKEKGTSKLNLSLSELKAGSYMIKIITGQQNLSRQIIKQ